MGMVDEVDWAYIERLADEETSTVGRETARAILWLREIEIERLGIDMLQDYKS